MGTQKPATKETTKKKTTQKKKSVDATNSTKTAAKTARITTRTQEPAAANATKALKSTDKGKPRYTQEKRKHLRLHYSRLISFVHYDADDHIEMPGGMAAIKDLSQAGILIETGLGFEPGDKLDLDIAFEQDRIIPAYGEVVHNRKTSSVLYHAGLKFTKIKRKDLVYLKGFLDGKHAQE